MLKVFHKVLVLILVLYSCVSFSAGIYPFEQNVLSKEFLPENNILKYLVIVLLLLFILFLSGMSVKNMFQVDDVKVLLSTV